jgi:uncharacterized protein YraI
VIIEIRRQGVKRAVAMGLATIAGVAVTLTVSAQPAVAAGTYSTTATVNVRSGPGTGYGIIGSAANGATFTLLCQWQGGTNVNGNSTWDKVTFSNGLTGAISDYYTTTPSWNSYAPNTGPCSSSSSREQRAMDWARSVLGQTHTNGDLGDSNHAWDGWCDNFVAHAYGLAASGYATAIAHYNHMASQGLISTTGTPPSGALVFYAAAAINGYAGHVMLSEGNGNYITTAPTIRRVSLTWPGATYLGWSWANSNWPGR